MRQSHFSIWLQVMMVSLFLSSASAKADDGKFFPIEYSCPIDGNGHVKVLRMNDKDDEVRINLSYSDGEPKIVTYSMKKQGQKNYKEYIEFDPRIHYSKEGKKVFIYGMGIYAGARLKKSTEYKDFEREIWLNRKKFGIE